MASFVRLVGVDNTEEVVNLDLVTRMVRFETNHPFTGVYFDHDNSISVRETPAEILGGFPQNPFSQARTS